MFAVASLLLHLLLVSLVHAIPITLTRRGVPQSLLSQLSLVSQYAAAAYCPANNSPSSSASITCSVGNCPQVQSAGATSVVEFQNLGLTDATGFVAVDHTNRLIVIAFRGTNSVGNWLANLDLFMENWSFCKGCQVHAGFLDSWNSARPIVKPALDAAIRKWPQYQVIATGHSLGASMATIGAAELRSQGYAVGLYTYGSPMAGNRAFAQFVTNQGRNYRVTHQEDVIPKLPGYLLGFGHVSSEYWVKSGDKQPVTVNDIAVSSGVIDLSGNQGTWGSSLDNHYWYFGDITRCEADFELKE